MVSEHIALVVKVSVGLLVAVSLIYVALTLGTTGGEKEYAYSVKVSHTAGENSNVTATPMGELSPSLQDAIFRAFEQMDHALGGSASVQMVTDERLSHDTAEWKIVEVEGSRFLVGIEGEPEMQRSMVLLSDDPLRLLAGLISFVVGLIVWGGTLWRSGGSRTPRMSRS